MSALLGDDWQEVGTELGLTAGRLSFISESFGTVQAAKAKMLDTYRLSDESIKCGLELPHYFLKKLKYVDKTSQIVAFVQSKV